MHLKLEVKWNTDGYSLRSSMLSKTVFVLNAPDNWRTAAYRSMLNKKLGEVFGFLNTGFSIEPLEFAGGGVGPITVLVMESPLCDS